ncbi:MFS-type transporter SLC18B1 [Aphelenchoides fujianensis]|nr:MFS-type transporter SLC18B1 [Aphelenchoides fujianensis]
MSAAASNQNGISAAAPNASLDGDDAEIDENSRVSPTDGDEPNGALKTDEERPFIALPFMRKIATQLSVEERKATAAASQTQRSRQRNQQSDSQRGSSREEEEESSESDAESGDEVEVRNPSRKTRSTSESGSTSSSSSYARFSDLTRKQWVTIGMLAIANLCSTIAFSCLAPFYPSEAAIKGMNTFQTGIVFGVFELVILCTAPFLGKYMAVIGSKRMFTVGLLVTGITAILFGFLNLLPLLGDACFVTSSFAISAKCFPGRIATIVGIMETFAGLGYTAGPVIGAVLYDLGGFMLPFIVLGTLLILATILSIFIVDTTEDETSEETEGMIGMLKMPLIWLMIFAVVICAVSLSFFDPTLADHLRSFNLSTTLVGFMFLLCGGIYTVTAPLWGLLLDRWDVANSLMLFGSAASVVAMLFVGPSPLFGMEKSLVVIGLSLSLFGIASGALYIPTFQNCLNAVKERGYEDNFQTYGCVSGIFQAAFRFRLVPPSCSQFVHLFVFQWIGFEWTTTIIAGLNVLFVVILVAFFGVKKCTSPPEGRSSASSSPDKSRASPEV